MKQNGSTTEYFSALLRQAGYKATPGRIALLQVLKASKEPLSIQEIMKKLKGAAIDQATAYRILSVLEKIGAVKQINLRHGHIDYEFADSADHHHVVCTSCGATEDFEGCDTESLMKKVSQKIKNFSVIDQHSLEFFGICKVCARK